MHTHIWIYVKMPGNMVLKGELLVYRDGLSLFAEEDTSRIVYIKYYMKYLVNI